MKRLLAWGAVATAGLAAVAGVTAVETGHRGASTGKEQMALSGLAVAANPDGVTGSWKMAFDDEFSGTSVDTSKWAVGNGGDVNAVTTSASDVSEHDGYLSLELSSSSTGSVVCSGGDDTPCGGTTADGYALPVGGYAEARIWFPGSGTTIDNWPAWWTSGDNWPASGEADIAEGLGDLTVNYHSPSGPHNQNTVPGDWSSGWHVYGLYRGSGFDDVYWDGKLVKSFPTDDNGQPEAMILNVGRGRNAVYGAASAVKVDYVRAWSGVSGGTAPAPSSVAPSSSAAPSGDQPSPAASQTQAQNPSPGDPAPAGHRHHRGSNSGRGRHH